MLALGCKTIKDGVMTAFIFLITGLSLILVGYWIVPDIWYFSHIIILSGTLLLFLVPVILIATYIKNSKKSPH
ncbi:MAG: hypothetical protein OQL19_19615 [Gammaproteobacteria bacterium]|nr:hypothetical protein [Gammaproteobacteria bacterium]